MKLLKTFVAMSVGISLLGCGKIKHADEPQKNELSLDGVKLISESISNTQDPDALLQEKYELGPTRRLLLRFEKLNQHQGKILLGADNKVRLQIRVVSPVATASALRLCPLTRDWMMLSTWQHAHPFNGEGRWRKPGGDYDEEGCVAGTAAVAERGTTPLRGTLHFDITRWFIDFPKGRSVNWGLILTATSKVEVAGEKSGTYSPRLMYDSAPPAPQSPWRN